MNKSLPITIVFLLVTFVGCATHPPACRQTFSSITQEQPEAVSATAPRVAATGTFAQLPLPADSRDGVFVLKDTANSCYIVFPNEIAPIRASWHWRWGCFFGFPYLQDSLFIADFPSESSPEQVKRVQNFILQQDAEARFLRPWMTDVGAFLILPPSIGYQIVMSPGPGFPLGGFRLCFVLDRKDTRTLDHLLKNGGWVQGQLKFSEVQSEMSYDITFRVKSDQIDSERDKAVQNHP